MRKGYVVSFSAFTISSALSIIIYILVFESGTNNFGFNAGQPSNDFGAWSLGCLMLIMLAGVLCGTLFDSISPGDGAVSLSEIGAALRSRRLVRALVVSPVVFFTFLSQADDFRSFLMAALFSFQNGFFWQKTLSAKVEVGRNST